MYIGEYNVWIFAVHVQSKNEFKRNYLLIKNDIKLIAKIHISLILILNLMLKNILIKSKY